MNYKPAFIVLGTFIMGLVVGLLLAGVVIRKQLEPVRNLQTAKGIKAMVSKILADETDTAKQAAIFEVLNENIAEMQALDLEYRSEMQINMDSLAKDLQPYLSEEQNFALQQRIEENRQTIDKRFAKSNRLKELENRIEELELQITEQIEEDKQENLSSSSSSSVSSSVSSKINQSNIPKTTPSPIKQTPPKQDLEVNRLLVKDVLEGYYGGNPRLINAFFTIRFQRDTSLFQDFIQKHFTGEIGQLKRVLNRQFRNKNRFHPHRPNQKRQPPFANRPSDESEAIPNSTPNRESNSHSAPPFISEPKEQTFDNDNDNQSLEIERGNESLTSENDTTDNSVNQPPFNRPNRPVLHQMALNRILQRQFAGDSTAMQQFIVEKFEGDTLLFLETARERFQQQRKRRHERGDW